MSTINLCEIDGLDFLSRDNDPSAETEILAALDRTKRAPSISGAAGSLYFSLGELVLARTHLRDAVRRARGTNWELGYLLGRKVSIAIGDGELSYARSLAERGYVLARRDSPEVAGRLAYQLGLAYAHSGRFREAKSFYEECHQSVEEGSYFWASARLGLSILAMYNKEPESAREYLAPLADKRLPATLKAYWYVAKAKIAAYQRDYGTAADWQSRATHHFGPHRLADRGVSTAETIEYLLRAGRYEEGRRVALGATRLIQKCGNENAAVATALTELVRAGLSAELSRAAAEECAAQLREINQTGQGIRRLGSSRRPHQQ